MVGLQIARLVLGEAFDGNYSWPMESRVSFQRKKAIVRFSFLFIFYMCDAGNPLFPTVAHTTGSICVTLPHNPS